MEDIKGKKGKNKKCKQIKSDEMGKLTNDPKNKGNKMKQFLRTVKANNSFNLKGPRSSKGMKMSEADKDLVEAVNSEVKDLNIESKPSTTSTSESYNINSASSSNFNTRTYTVCDNIFDTDSHAAPPNTQIERDNSVLEFKEENLNTSSQTKNGEEDVLQLEKGLTFLQLSQEQTENDDATALPSIHSSLTYCNRIKSRTYSLDQNLLYRRQSWSQSEEQLHVVGKLPLERKRSFFRKRLDKFLKNTSDVFKKKSYTSEFTGPSILSFISTTSDGTDKNQSISISSDESNSCTATNSQCSLVESQLGEQSTSVVSSVGSFGDSHSFYSSHPRFFESTSSLIGYKQDPVLNYRAISFNSGLDNVKASKKTNRVTWLASDSVADYFRRVGKDKKFDIECNIEKSPSRWGSWNFPRVDSRVRRFSYQRAVSGEEPTRLKRRRKLSEIRPELVTALAKLRKHGVPPVKTYDIPILEEGVWAQIDWVANFPECLSLTCKHDDYDSNMLCQQNIIMEFMATESYHIKYMQTTIELFLSTAAELKSQGFLEDVDLDIIFSNIIEVFYATIFFWDETIAPMINDAFMKRSSYRLQLMCAGFSRCRETLAPYEKYVTDQTKSIDYLRVLNGNAEFMTYLTWCHTHHLCQRLTLGDMLIKPMQRLTKYELLIGRLLPCCFDYEQPCLRAMEMYAKNFVTEINMAMRHVDEMDKFERMLTTVQNYNVDFRDEDLNKVFDANNGLNLRAPVYRCHSSFTRQLVHEGELRFRDEIRETRVGNGVDVRAFLMTDLFMVAKKKSSPVGLFTHKLIRPKFLLSRMDISVVYKKPAKGADTGKEIDRLIVLVKDEVGSSLHCFELTDPKDGSQSLKVWDMKFKEARFAYNLACDASNRKTECDGETLSEFLSRAHQHTPLSAEEVSIHKEAVERVAVMKFKQRGSSTDQDVSQSSFKTDSADGENSGRCSGLRTVRSPPPPLAVPQSQQHAHPRPPSEASSHNSRVSSFQHSASATSHDEMHICAVDIPRITPRNMPWQKMKFPLPLSQNIQYEVYERARSTDAIEEEPYGELTFMSRRRSPMLQICISSDNDNDVTIHGESQTPSYSSRTLSPSPNNSVKNLRVKSPEKPMVLSLPNLLSDVSSRSRDPERRNRLSAPPSRPRSANLLSPDRRGTTYPPPSPTNRGALKRGFAFSHSVKNRLTKMGHVGSQTQLTVDGTVSQQNNTIARMERGGSFTSPTVLPIITPNEIIQNPPIASQSISVNNVTLTQSYPEPSTSSLVTTTDKQTEMPRSDEGGSRKKGGIRKFIELYEKMTKK